ncbi:unnamed protein product [Phytophthora lilii]|uniref:Unnamed protein product n=1 Tax=Phytophthora lilii TaxID=2077276 RepID=A0A9W6U460_9STRA|nr:unnamed protein product [Phytophthora lilii]
MILSRVRSMLEEAGHRRRQAWARSTPSEDATPIPSMSTEEDDDTELEETRTAMVLSDEKMLERARAAHMSEDFASLAAGPEANGPWERVDTFGRFVVFRRQVVETNNGDRPNDLEVLCAGRLDASLEEVASILRSSSEGEHNAIMTALYAKNFIFGSYDREVPCAQDHKTHQTQDDDSIDDRSEQLVVKTKSFARTTILGNNEQWCYFDYFQRKKERDGFTISKRALLPSESIPGRIAGVNAHVDQLHGLNASYLVDKLPNQKGLRVVFHAWFEPPDQDTDRSRSSSRRNSSRSSQRRSSSSSSSSGGGLKSIHLDFRDTSKHKAHMRRLLAMAHGITKLPELVRRRRFGVQVPADLNRMQVHNSRCPCCTHSLAPVKLSLAKAASAIANRSWASLKVDTRRCYLCGYLVCVDCWSAEHMESAAGRVAAIVVCTRCQANVQACEYSEVFADTATERAKHRGPPRVVEDSSDTPTISLLIDFLSASLLNAPTGSREHTAALAVIKSLLHSSESNGEHDNYENEGRDDYESVAPQFEVLDDSEIVDKIEQKFSYEAQKPISEACKLGNAELRSYPLDLPEDPTVDLPRSPIPSDEVDRIAAANAAGLLLLADRLAPESPGADLPGLMGDTPDTHDLELLCQLAAKTLDCAYSFVAIMCAKHEHFLAASHSSIAGAVVPREHTTCQHALMSPLPLVTTHSEADVRFHKQSTTTQLHIRFYVGFPLRIPKSSGDGVVTVGMFCCIDSKPRAEIPRSQYATMKCLANTATTFLLQKARRLQHPSPPPSANRTVNISASSDARSSILAEAVLAACRSSLPASSGYNVTRL